ncbi:MAG: hypothetical protein M9894_21510 [Planctomycetes bacterium]|nr:hypothetical protein [Planctomycetota bacterium]
MNAGQPKVVTTDRIPEAAIDPDALKVIRRLRRYGHEAYLVGGCVRDLLLGVQPKDFDVITSARPRQVRRLFSNSRVIGRRFRLVHVIFGDNVVEVSTFRADPAQFTAEQEPGVEAVAPGEADAEAPEVVDAGVDEVDVDGAEEADDDLDGEPDEADEDEADEDEADEEDGGAGEAPVSLSELGQLVETVHDPLDPDDPGPKRELEPDVDEVAEEGDDEAEPLDDDGRRRARGPRDEDIDANNLFGDPEQDARRRDFTINALFYDPDRGELIDYTGGLEDLERRLVNPIRDPEVAFVEDPVRMIRAARFAAKLGFTIEERALTAIARHRGLLAECSQRRLLEEVLKILKGGYASRCMELLITTGLVEQFLPDVAGWLAEGPPPAGRPADDGAPAAATPPGSGEGAEAHSGEVAALAQGDEATAGASTDDATADDEPGGDEPGGDESGAQRPAASVPEEIPPVEAAEDPREDWGPAVPVAETGVVLHPHDDWEPDRRMVDAYLRVTWERPPLEGANDWVEDPHVYLMDGIFEAAAFARDTVLQETGRADLAALAAERDRAGALLRVLRWNGRLEQIVASFPEEEESRAGRRRRRRREHEPGGRRAATAARAERAASAAHAGGAADEAPVVASLLGLERQPLLLAYLEGLDRLNARGVPLTPAIQLAVLFAPLLLTRLEEGARARGNRSQPSSEELADGLLFPIARRHSLARRDRDRMKRIVLSLRRMLSGELRRRARHGGRLAKVVGRDYFREAIVLLWLHCRATSAGWEDFRYWEGRAKLRGR